KLRCEPIKMSAYSYEQEKRPIGAETFAGPALFILCVVCAIPLFWDGLISLGTAWATPEYSHGPLIPILSAYLFLREMRMLPPSSKPVVDRWPGVIVITFALLVAVVGQIVRIPDIITYAFIIWVAGLVLVSYGFSRGIFFWASVVHLIYMLPLPQFIYWKLTISLQFVSSEIGVWFIRLMDIPVYLDGNVIDLGEFKLLVAEACSGLRYLFPILSFSFIFAVLYKGPRWHKAVILLSAAPITILMNSFRIGVIGFMVDQRGIEAAQGFLHLFEGWVIFGSCVVILFLLAILMQRLSPNPKPLADTIDLDFEGLHHQAAKITKQVATPALIVATAVTATVTTAFVISPQAERAHVLRDPFALFPRQLGEWSGSSQLLDRNIERILGADDYYASFYRKPGEAAGVDFFSAYYHKLTEGQGIHSPEVCIPAAGWEMAKLGVSEITVEGSGRGAFPVNRAIIEKGLNKQLVYYWFEQRGRQLTNDYVAKAYTIWDSITLGRTDGALVRVITPIMPNERMEVAEARLHSFLKEALPILPNYIPGNKETQRTAKSHSTAIVTE
ncbi:MAG: VPLPA-CTERM-specific exosortase XrtD, partial [Pseudomonadota bacterium]